MGFPLLHTVPRVAEKLKSLNIFPEGPSQSGIEQLTSQRAAMAWFHGTFSSKQSSQLDPIFYLFPIEE